MIIEKVLTNTGVGIKENILFSMDDRKKYNNRFLEAKKLMFIHADANFDDTKWIYRKAGVLCYITFFSEVELKNICKKNKLNINYEYLDIAFKYYMLEIICKFSKAFIFNVCITIKKILLNPSLVLEIVKKTYQSGHFEYLKVLEFLEFSRLNLISESDINIILGLEIKQVNAIRKIPNFLSIFDFIDIIDRFIIDATDKELKRYFPVILWWKISSIIPLRPSELLATEYNCLIEQNGRYLLKIRRSKGKQGDIYSQEGATIETYYYDDIVEITQDVYRFISTYKKFLKNTIDGVEMKLLFSKKLYLESKYVIYDDVNTTIITSRQLGHLLNDFYTTIVQYKYNKIPYKTDDETSLSSFNKDKYIEQLTPYDSRHIAIINLIMLGNEPQTVMKLAGHKKIKTTQGYYNHIEEYADAYSISFAKKIKRQNVQNNMYISNRFNSASADLELILNKYKHKIKGGFCTYSLKDFKPCYKVEGKHYRCPYFIANDNKENLKDNITKVNNELVNEIEILKDIVECRKSISDFSERYSILIESIDKNIVDKAIMISKL